MTTPKQPGQLAAAIAALDLIGRIDALQARFCKSALLTTDTLCEATWIQKHVDADRKAAIKKLAKALDPIPFRKLPDDLLWIRGQAEAPCYVCEADRRALLDLIGPDPYAKEEEAAE